MKFKLSVYTIIHFLVDLTCIYRLYSQLLPLSGTYETWLFFVLLYNFLAFALPGLVGYLADRLELTDWLAALGCIMTAVPSILTGFPVPAIILQGVGNGFFHVGAGRRIIMESGGKYTDSGVFICSGAMGVFLGTVWRKNYSALFLKALAGILIICAVLLIMFVYLRREKGISTAAAESKVEKRRFVTFPVILIFIVVILRSFYGNAISYQWKDTFVVSLIFAVCIVAGKALGGIAADLVGVRLASVVSLGGAAVTVLFSGNSPLFGCLSILLFNMTMPITLGLIASYWKNYPGFAFGILMVALFIGTLPDMVFQGIKLPVSGLCIVSLVSLTGLIPVVGKKR